jgi:hypothetical protein
MSEIEELRKILKDHEKRISKLESLQITSKPAEKQKPKTRKTVADLLLELKNEGFFKQPKNLSSIVDRLAQKNYKVSFGDLTRPLARLVRSDILQREKIEGKWAYRTK